MDDPDTGLPDKEGGADNPCTAINIPDTDNTDGKVDNPGSGTEAADVDGRADNRRANDPGKGINKFDTDIRVDDRIVDNSSTDTDKPDADGRVDERKADYSGTNTSDANQDVDGGADLSTDPAILEANR